MMSSLHAKGRLAYLVGIAITRHGTNTLSANLTRPITTLTSLSNLNITPIQQKGRISTSIRAQSPGVSSDASTAGAMSGKKKVVFLGTPDVAALVLQKLLDASKLPDSTFDVAAVVSQPSRPKGRNRKPQPSPVEQLAVDSGLDSTQILCPERATDAEFLAKLTDLQPDLCITAAYGNYLPTKFLAIPRFGTLNIHPSLLPAYRGAAPVQRALQDGLDFTGVTVLYTVKAMDAGPILAQQKYVLDDEVQAPELLKHLFSLGTELILKNLEVVWAGMGEKIAQPQNESAATHAAKITREEGALRFEEPARVSHNKVRAFAGWPGTYHTFELTDAECKSEDLELKILKTRVAESPTAAAGGEVGAVAVGPGGLKIVCGDGKVLELLEVQAPGRKAVAAKDFVNGLKGKTLKWKPASEE